MQVSHKNNNNNKHNNKNRETVLELLGRYWIVVGVNDLQPMSKANGANALRTCPSPFWAKRKQTNQGAASQPSATAPSPGSTSPQPSSTFTGTQLSRNYKILFLTCKSPQNLSNLLNPYTPSLNLRASDTGLLSIPHTGHCVALNRAFSVAAPAFWTALPASSLDIFKILLEHHLFTTSYNLDWLCFPSRHSTLLIVSTCLFACLCSTYSPVSHERRFINQSYNYSHC